MEYRRGPEHKFPIWWEDALEVARFIIENKESYGIIVYIYICSSEIFLS